MTQKMFTLPVVTVAAAGTRVPLTAGHVVASTCVVEADPANTGYVYVGDDTVTSTNGMALLPGDSVTIESDKIKSGNEEIFLEDIYVDAQTSGNKVRVQYLKRK